MRDRETDTLKDKKTDIHCGTGRRTLRDREIDTEGQTDRH